VGFAFYQYSPTTVAHRCCSSQSCIHLNNCLPQKNRIEGHAVGLHAFCIQPGPPVDSLVHQLQACLPSLDISRLPRQTDRLIQTVSLKSLYWPPGCLQGCFQRRLHRQTDGQTRTPGLVGARLITWLPTQIAHANRRTDTYSRACCCQADRMASTAERRDWMTARGGCSAPGAATFPASSAMRL